VIANKELNFVKFYFSSLIFQEVNHNLDDTLAMNVTPVSNTSLELGMGRLRRELVRIARNKNLSPNIDINLPESWVNIEQAIKKCRKNGDIPCLSIAELQEVLKEQGIDVSECELHSCVSYLDAIGELQYFKVSLYLSLRTIHYDKSPSPTN
jgi:hypothetical protein